jgi:hypothetical protein
MVISVLYVYRFKRLINLIFPPLTVIEFHFLTLTLYHTP